MKINDGLEMRRWIGSARAGFLCEGNNNKDLSYHVGMSNFLADPPIYCRTKGEAAKHCSMWNKTLKARKTLPHVRKDYHMRPIQVDVTILRVK